MKKNILLIGTILLLSFTAFFPVLVAQNSDQGSVSTVSKQKRDAENAANDTRSALVDNEQLVSETLANLRQIDADILTSEEEIEKVQEQLEILQDTIGVLEADIEVQEQDLQVLREEYLKSVKKMRIARKRNSGLVFVFAAKSLEQARRRVRYMREFSAWRNRRSKEITGKIDLLHTQRHQLVQAHEDVAVALQREQSVQHSLAQQREEQQVAVQELRANSETLKSKLAQRQEEARILGNRISELIEDLQDEYFGMNAGDEYLLSEEGSYGNFPGDSANPVKGTPDKGEYASARNKNLRSSDGSETEIAEFGFGGMKGNLPRPVNGTFKIVSAFGVHPVSPELPDIMDENLGIDAHVTNGASVSAVYDGEVIKVYDSKATTGFRNIIIVRHGDYITVYANLETIAVKPGEKVTQGQKLGTAGSDFDNPKYGMIHFEVWKNQTRLDPAAWIRI